MISRHVSEMTTILIVDSFIFSLVSFSFVSSILCSSVLSASMTVISIITWIMMTRLVMIWTETACFGRGGGVAWSWGGGWGVNRAWNFVFSVSHLFQLSCPS